MASSTSDVPLSVENQVPLSNYNLDPVHALYLHHSDNPNCNLTSELLTGNNYAQWKRSCKVSLSAKNKMSFITGGFPKPSNDSPHLSLWERCNSMVISWLLHSVNKDIASSIIYTPTTEQTWQDLSKRFSFGQGTKIYQLQKEIYNLSQGNLSVSAYFTKCKQLWDEYIVLVTPCACASTGSAMKLVERQQLMQFLMGLNDSYQGVRSNILMMNPLPAVSQASSIVLQEEQQREMRPPVVQIDSGSTAFLSQQRSHTLPHPYHGKNSTVSSQHLHQSTGLHSFPSLPKRMMQPQTTGVQCNYCKKPGHTIKKCFKLQRQRNDKGQLDRNRRIVASVQQTSVGAENAEVHSSGQHTLTFEQYT